MSVFEGFLETFVQEILWASVKRIGSLIRWVILRNKYSYNQIYQQDWNGRVGLVALISVISIVIFFYNY
jgi:hypothetical protein